MLLQAKEYRMLRTFLNELLKGYDISTTEWIIMGMLHERGGVRLADVAKSLDVEAPLITSLIEKLEKKEITSRKADPFDKRARLVALTKKGKLLIPKIEKELQKKLKQKFKDIPDKDYATYVKVQQRLINALSE